MKRTSSMICKDTDESRELELYAENDSILYFGIYGATVANLVKKIKAGKYDKEKAIDAFYHVANEANNRYYKEFGQHFSVGARFTVACHMEEFFKTEYDLGNIE